MAPRAIWRGAITFGLITIPVRVYTAVGREVKDKIDLHLLHGKDGERIHYSRNCEKGHKDIDWDEIVKGYEHQRGEWVVVTDKDLDALELESLHTIDVVTFVAEEQVDPLFLDKSYYVVPDEMGLKPYKLMLEALAEEHMVGIAKVAIREREHLCVLRVRDKNLVMQTMHWAEEIREADFEESKKHPRIEDRERKMARRFIRGLSGDFDPTEFKDEYHAALKKLINKKINGEEIVVPERPKEPEVVDLMEALERSLAAMKRGEKPSHQSKGGGKGGRDGSLTSLTRKELEDRAKRLKIQGRSKMDKDELARAIESAG